MRSDPEDQLRFDIAFQIGRISKAELKALAGNDRSKRDRAKANIAARIVARIGKAYGFNPKLNPAPLHSAPIVKRYK